MHTVDGVRNDGCTRDEIDERGRSRLATETVQGAALSLQRVDDVHGGDGLSLGVLGVGDGITNDVLQEYLQDATGLLVDQAGDTLDTTSTGQTSDRWLGDTLDVVTKNLPVTLGATLAQAFASFTATGHDEFEIKLRVRVEKLKIENVVKNGRQLEHQNRK